MFLNLMSDFSDLLFDIDTEQLSDNIVPVNYNANNLSNVVYTLIENPHMFTKKYRKKFSHTPLGKDFYDIKSSCKTLQSNNILRTFIEKIFKQSEIQTLTSADYVFINSYARHILRANFESKYMRSDLNIDYIFTSAANVEYDNTLRAHLKYLKVICNYLGISNTYAS